MMPIPVRGATAPVATLALLLASLPAAAGMNVEIRSETVFDLEYQTAGLTPPGSISPWRPVPGTGNATFRVGSPIADLSLSIRYASTIVCFGTISVVPAETGAQCSASIVKSFTPGVTSAMACVIEFQNGGAEDCGITVRVLFP